MNKRKFKETNKSVTECLTSLRMTKLKDARDEYGFKKIWTSDGRIMVMEEGSAKPKVIHGWLLNQWKLCFAIILYSKTFIKFKSNYQTSLKLPKQNESFILIFYQIMPKNAVI